MEDNRKYAGYSDREYLCWFVKKDKGSLAFVLIMCIAWIGTWIVSLLLMIMERIFWQNACFRFFSILSTL